jgi:hypothetical protein
MRFSVKVIPKSSRQGVKIDGNVIKVWLHAAPADGRANEELVRTLANLFSVSKNRVTIVSGFSSRIKIVDILGVSGQPDQARTFPMDGNEKAA